MGEIGDLTKGRVGTGLEGNLSCRFTPTYLPCSVKKSRGLGHQSCSCTNRLLALRQADLLL